MSYLFFSFKICSQINVNAKQDPFVKNYTTRSSVILSVSFFPLETIVGEVCVQWHIAAKTLRYVLVQKAKINLHWEIFTEKKVTNNPILLFMHMYGEGISHSSLTDEWHCTKT